MNEKNYNLVIPAGMEDVFRNFFITDSDLENNVVGNIVDASYWHEIIIPNTPECIPPHLDLWVERVRLSLLFIYGSYNERSEINFNHSLFQQIIDGIFSTFDILFKDDSTYEKWKELYFLFRNDKIDASHKMLKSTTQYMFEKSYNNSDHILSFWDFLILYINMFPVEIYQMGDISDEYSIIPDIIEQVSLHRKYHTAVLFLADPPNVRSKCYSHGKQFFDDILEYGKVHFYCALALLKMNQFIR